MRVGITASQVAGAHSRAFWLGLGKEKSPFERIGKAIDYARRDLDPLGVSSSGGDRERRHRRMFVPAGGRKTRAFCDAQASEPLGYCRATNTTRVDKLP